MKKHISSIILFLFLTIGTSSFLNAQEKTTATVKISGEVEKPLSISTTD